MQPADQGLEADDRALHAGLRLIVQDELLACDAGPQIMLQRVALAGAPIHLGVEEAVGIAAFPLGTIESGVRIVEQGVGIPAVGREYRNPDAEREAQLVVADLDIAGDRIE